MKIFKKILVTLLILSVMISGCVDKSTSGTQEKSAIGSDIKEEKQPDRSIVDNLDWYMSIYEGPPNITNSENARMSIVPHLQELGWNEGMNIIYGTDISENHSMVITLPFKLSKRSTDYFNDTLSNFNYRPISLNKKIQNEG